MAAMKRKQERARQKAMGGTVEREKVMRDVNCLKPLWCLSWPLVWQNVSVTLSNR